MSTIAVQTQTIPDIFDVRLTAANPPHLRVFCSIAFTSNDVPPVYVPNGSIGGGKYYIDVACTYVAATGTVTVPTFNLISTTDALAPAQNASYTFCLFTSSGQQLSPDPVQSQMHDIRVPATYKSASSCSPLNKCMDWRDLLIFSRGPFNPNLDLSAYTKSEIDAKFAAVASSGAPASEKYIVQVADVAQIPNAQSLGTLTTGLLKNTVTGVTGVLSTAAAATDFQAPLIATTPLTLTGGNTLGLAGLSTLGTANQLVGMDATATVYEYKTLTTGTAGADFGIAFTPNTVTFNIPTAGAATRGVIANTGTLSLGAQLTFSAGTGTGILVGTNTTIALGTNVVTSVANDTNVTGSIATNALTLGWTGTLAKARIIATAVYNDQANTYSGTLLQDLTAAILKIPNGAGLQTATTATISYDTTANRFGGGLNSVYKLFVTPDSTDTFTNKTWNGVAIGTQYGGTGQNWSGSSGVVSINAGTGTISAITTNGVAYGAAANAINFTAAVANGVLVTSAGNVPSIAAPGVSLSVSGSVLNTIQNIRTTDTPQFAQLGLGQAAAAITILGVTGPTMSAQATATVASLQAGSTYTKNTNTVVTWNEVLISPTFTFGASDASTTVNILNVDSTNNVLTGSTVNLIRAGFGGVQQFSVSSGGVVNVATGFQIAGAATSANVLRGNGTNFVSSTLAAVDLSNGVTGSGLVALQASPTFITPVLGVATATTLNGNTFTTGTYTLTGVAGKTLTFNNSLTLAGTDATTITFQATDTYVGRATTDTLTNKTLSSSTNTLGGVTVTMGSDATGDMYYRNAGGQLVRLGIGSGTQFVGVSGGVPVWATPAGTGGTITSSSTNQMAFFTAATTVGGNTGIVTDASNTLSVTATARTSGAPTYYFRVVTPADTTLSASVESVGLQFGGTTGLGTVTRQWATGGLATQRENVFAQPTYAFVAASTLTTAATVAIIGAPIAGTNATITNPYSFWIQDGGMQFGPNTGTNGGATENDLLQWLPYVTSGAGLLFMRCTISDGNARAAGFTINGDYSQTLTSSTGRFPALFSTNSGTVGTPIASGKKGVFSGYEGTMYTAQSTTDMPASDPQPHVIGLTGIATGTAGVRNISATVTLGTAASADGQNYVGSITQNITSNGNSNNFYAFGGGTSNPDAAFRTAAGNKWNYGLDTNGSTFNNGAIRLSYGGGANGQIVARNQAANGDIPLINLASISAITNVAQIGAPAGITTGTMPITNLVVGLTSWINQTGTLNGLIVQGTDASITTFALAGVGAPGQIRFYRGDGTSAAFTGLVSGDVIGNILGFGWTNAPGISGAGSMIRMVASETWTGAAQGYSTQFFTTPTGTITQTEQARLMPYGGLQISNAQTALPAVGDFQGGSKAAVIITVKNSKLVFEYNNAGAVNYITIPLDGATGTWVNGAGAP